MDKEEANRNLFIYSIYVSDNDYEDASPEILVVDVGGKHIYSQFAFLYYHIQTGISTEWQPVVPMCQLFFCK